MICYLQKGTEIIRCYTQDDLNIECIKNNGVSYLYPKENFNDHYQNLLTQGYVDVTNKYFSVLLGPEGSNDYCVIKIDDSYRFYEIIRGVGGNSITTLEGAKLEYEKLVAQGYNPVDPRYYADYSSDEHDYVNDTMKQHYMFGLDSVIDLIPLPDFYKEHIFNHFKKR